jgi:hypothetical protein
MFDLKPLDSDAIPRALEKVERYRLLNEPEEAESICLDILAIEPDHQQALVMLLLSLSDQFPAGCADCFHRAQELLPRLHEEYERRYYAGLLCERRGNSLFARGGLNSGKTAYDWLRKAMEWYERAEEIRPPQNDDAILRWNTCARVIMKHYAEPPAIEPTEPVLLE